MWGATSRRSTHSASSDPSSGRGVSWDTIHTYGHAAVKDLQPFVEALASRTLVPIHSFETGRFAEFFDNVVRKDDGVWLEV